MMPQNNPKKVVLVIGATSAIARGACIDFAKKGYEIILAARNTQELQRIDDDLHLRYGAIVHYCHYDADALISHQEFINDVIKKSGALTGVLLCFGYLGDHAKAEQDINERKKILNRNFIDAVDILTVCADYFERQKKGFIIAVSSVAGDRGRGKSYYYGAAKAGLNHFLEGLRCRLSAYPIRIITIKPGFVDTPMNFGKPNMFLVAKPEAIGKKIVASLDKRSNIVYLPWFWRVIMRIIKLIPQGIFKHLKI